MSPVVDNEKQIRGESQSSGQLPAFLPHDRLHTLFSQMDADSVGTLTLPKLKVLERKHSNSLGSTSEVEGPSGGQKGTLREWRMRKYLIENLIVHMESKGADEISFEGFQAFIRDKEWELWGLFREIDSNSSGYLSKRQIQGALRNAGVVISDEDLKAFIYHIDSDQDGVIGFDEWSEFLLFSPQGRSLRHIYSFYLNIIHQSDTGDQLLLPESSTTKAVTFKYMIAGGFAGAISRTVTAPLDRIRVLLMCKTGPESVASGLSINSFVTQGFRVVKDIYADGGITAFWRGNAVNIVKIIPESAIRFYVFESVKKILKQRKQGRVKSSPPSASSSDVSSTEKPAIQLHANSPSTFERMVAGGAAGFASQFFIYPLETIKTRMMADLEVSGNAARVSAWKTTKQILRKDGFPAFFRGIGPSLLGIIPYASIDLTAYESLKQFYHNITGDRKPSTLVHLVCGATAGAVSATAVYPLGLIRTRLQAQGTSAHQHRYPRGAIDVISMTYQKESIRGFYKGLVPTLIKVVPAVSISYITYEKAKEYLEIS